MMVRRLVDNNALLKLCISLGVLLEDSPGSETTTSFTVLNCLESQYVQSMTGGTAT
jgi:hypothetical protein